MKGDERCVNLTDCRKKGLIDARAGHGGPNTMTTLKLTMWQA